MMIMMILRAHPPWCIQELTMASLIFTQAPMANPLFSLNGWKIYGLHVDTSLSICTSSFKSRFLTWNRKISRRIFENMTCFKKMKGTKNTKVILFNSIKAPGKSEKHLGHLPLLLGFFCLHKYLLKFTLLRRQLTIKSTMPHGPVELLS